MSKSDTLEAAFLNIVFKGVAFANVFDNAATSPLANLYVSLHTADPGEAGTQATSEITYTSYARVAVTRGAGWTLTGSSISPAATIGFPAGTGGSGVATHFGVGTDVSGVGRLLYSGAISPTITTGAGITPQLTTASTITED
jgi:hypothetical protein